MPSPAPHHRHSASSDLRGLPTSPRVATGRHASLSNSLSSTTGGVNALATTHDLLSNPPRTAPADPAFVGREWGDIRLEELIDAKDVVSVEQDTSVETATKILLETDSNVVLIRKSASDRSAVAAFDYKDLNQYLLFATGCLRPDEAHLATFESVARKAQRGEPIPVKDAKSLGDKEPFVLLPRTAKLTEVVERFGGGVHRIIAVAEDANEVVGVLSQWKLVKFLWDNGESFPVIDQLYPSTLQDAGIGSHSVISIDGDRPLREALVRMDCEGITSLAVVDNANNVVGNISTVDVKLLTKSSAAPLLDQSCIHFISVILSSRGMADGQDSFPVFYVNPYSTLAHTVAKLVATKSHRMWMVDSPSPSTSNPTTPSFAVTPPATSPALFPHHLPPHHSGSMLPTSPTVTTAPVSVLAASNPGTHMSGRLCGVVSLTDVLNLFARASGLHPSDPAETRRNRRRSSSSSLVVAVEGVDLASRR